MKKIILSAGLSFLTIHGAGAAVVISEIDLANNRVELVNTGTTASDVSSYWWCNRVNGSPFYTNVDGANSTINAGLSTATSFNIGAGEILVLDLLAATLPDVNGELGFYNTNSFGSAAAIEDYVLWGADGTRDSVAEAAGIWTDNQSIDVTGLGAGDTIQLSQGTDGNSVSSYFLGAGSLGTAQSIPEPSALTFSLLASLGFMRRRRK